MEYISAGTLYLRDKEFPMETNERGLYIKVFDDLEPNAWLKISPWLLKELNKEVNKGLNSD